MAKQRVLILNSGGVKSLVATASRAEAAQVCLMFVDDGRPSTRYGHEAYMQQAEHFEVSQRFFMSVGPTWLAELNAQREVIDGQRSPLGAVQLLMAGLDAAIRSRCERVVWPICLGHDFDQLAWLTETIQLVQHQLALQNHEAVQVDLPFVELELPEVLRLGAQLDVPWEMARTCRADAEKACGQCRWCRQRATDFVIAGVDDPMSERMLRATDS